MTDIFYPKKEYLAGLTGMGGGPTGLPLKSAAGAAAIIYSDEVFSLDFYRGTDANITINNGLDMTEGGLVLVKTRNTTYSLFFFDTERGATKALTPSDDNTNDEFTEAKGVHTFSSNGWQIGGSGGDGAFNKSGNSYWSSTFRTAKGFFDCIEYTGTGSDREIAHNLKCAPSVMLIKGYDFDGEAWTLYHDTQGKDYYYILNAAGTRDGHPSVWDNTAETRTEPTDEKFYLGTSHKVNKSGQKYVAYLFGGGKATSEYSVDFDGSTELLSIPDSSDFEIDGTSFTLECWFRADDLDGGQAIAGHWESGGGTNRNFDFYLSGSTLYFENCRGSTNYSVSTTVGAGQWYHIAGVLDGTTLKLFVNGNLVGTTTVSGSANNSTAPFGIGGYATGTAEVFNGQISNLRFVKGQAIYTDTFKPSLRPLTTTSQGATASNVKLLACNKQYIRGATASPNMGGVNDGTVWSTGEFKRVSDNSDVTWATSSPISEFFNGRTAGGDSAYPESAGDWYWTIPDVPCTSTCKIKYNAGTGIPSYGTQITLVTDAGSVSVAGSSGTLAETSFTLPAGTTKLTKITCPAGTGQNWFDPVSFEVDGTMLVDPVVAPSGNPPPFNTTTDSSRQNPFVDEGALAFGEDSDQNIVKAGSYIGSGTDTEVYVGFEPQWVLLKCSNASERWMIFDTMSGMPVVGSGSGSAYLQVQDSAAQITMAGGMRVYPTSTGFKIDNESSSFVNASGNLYIWLAIRRHDPAVSTSPSAGTDVFAMNAPTGSSSIPEFISNFPVDFGLYRKPGSVQDWYNSARLIQPNELKTSSKNAESSWANGISFDYNNGWGTTGQYTPVGDYQSWMWKRSPSFTTVCWEGDDVTGRRIIHDLNKTPEMIWIKKRTGTGRNWPVYHKGLNGGSSPEDYVVWLNLDNAEADESDIWNDTAPTSTYFTIGGGVNTNEDGELYIAMLFASVEGISQCGFYDGSNSDVTITFDNGGFSPRFVLIKRVNASGDWVTLDTTRGWGTTGPVNDCTLYLNKTNAEYCSTYDWGAPTSTGMRLGGGSGYTNTSGSKYMYYAHS